MKKIKWYIWLIVGVVVIFLFKITLGTTFLFSADGWNADERQINSPNLIARGVGNEPGWTVEVRGETFDHSLFGASLVLDYGESSWDGVLTKTWQEEYSQSFQVRGDVSRLRQGEVSEEEKNVIVFFQKKECVDDSGRARLWEVHLNFHGEKEYKGCADVNFENKP
jgi:uncharacterized membrane protein